MLSHALVVKITAKADQSETVAQFLSGALPLAQAELFTPVWFAIGANGRVRIATIFRTWHNMCSKRSLLASVGLSTRSFELGCEESVSTLYAIVNEKSRL